MTQPKIAFIWSGQTRGSATTQADNDATLRTHTLISEGFDVDHFGHTWSDQQEPFNSHMMKRWIQTDQQDILNWCTDNYNRIMFHQDWTSEPEWNRLSKTQQFERVLDLQKPLWGQLWSFLEGLHQLGYQNVKNYDYIIKTRYDTCFYDNRNNLTCGYSDDWVSDEQAACKIYNQQLHYLLQFKPQRNWCFTSHDGWGNGKSGYIMDHVIVFRAKDALRAIAQESVPQILDRYIRKCRAIHQSDGPSNHYWETMSHSMWYEFVVANGMSHNFSLPSFFSRNSNLTIKNKNYEIGSDW